MHSMLKLPTAATKVSHACCAVLCPLSWHPCKPHHSVQYEDATTAEQHAAAEEALPEDPAERRQHLMFACHTAVSHMSHMPFLLPCLPCLPAHSITCSTRMQLQQSSTQQQRKHCRKIPQSAGSTSSWQMQPGGRLKRTWLMKRCHSRMRMQMGCNSVGFESLKI